MNTTKSLKQNIPQRPNANKEISFDHQNQQPNTKREPVQRYNADDDGDDQTRHGEDSEDKPWC